RRIGDAARRDEETGEPSPVDAVADVLARHGYEPRTSPSGEIALANCPFHRLAEDQRPLVCGMNLDFVGGIIEGLGSVGPLEARLAPGAGYCCVRVWTPWAAPAPGPRLTRRAAAGWRPRRRRGRRRRGARRRSGGGRRGGRRA